ncbi:MAG TPA: hypothetical protein DEG28_00945 [Porphyromonadaceae bacterium]|mgnify:CR=1 FL=1|nr:hypothetical protein [Porphyromonadaceae bacterium]
MKTETESVFMQMHNGTRTGEGSFYVGLQKLFYLADQSNRRKLVEAFPDFFGDEVPEFGIANTEDGIDNLKSLMMKKYRQLGREWAQVDWQIEVERITNPGHDLQKRRNNLEAIFRFVEELLPGVADS